MSDTTQLTVPERAAIALGTAEHEKNLLALATKYSDITKIVNPAGREQCHAAYMELKNTRVNIEKAGKDAREDANAFQKAVIEEVKRLTAITAAEEARLQVVRDTYDAEREAERQAKAATEKVRVDAIRKRIAETQAIPSMLVGKSSETIAAAIESLEVVDITIETHQEFAGEAEVAKLATVQKLWEMFKAQQEHEAEAARLQAEREQLARERAEAAERERLAAIERQRAEDEQRIARAKAEAAALAERQAEQRKLDEQRAELARQQAELAAERQRQADDAARVEREKQETIAAEAERVAAEERRQQEAEDRVHQEQKERERAEILAARYASEPTGGTWSIGKTWGSIVTTAEIAGSPGTGHNDVEYYGGNLICESVWRPADACVLAAAHDMLDLLKELIDIEGPQPGNNEWATKVKAAITKATYVPEVQSEAQAA